MIRHVCGRLVTEWLSVGRYVIPGRVCVPVRRVSDLKDEALPPFDASLLELLVCPLSKKPLRYEPKTNELINEELGIAYPITDGIPNMIPQEARLIQRDPNTSDAPQE